MQTIDLLVLNPLNQRDLTQYDPKPVKDKDGVLSIKVSGNPEIEGFVNSLLTIGETSVTIKINNPLSYRILTADDYDQIVNTFGRDYGLTTGDHVVLAGNSRLHVCRELIKQFEDYDQSELILTDVPMQERLEFDPLDLITEQTIDNSAVPMTSKQRSKNAGILIDVITDRLNEEHLLAKEADSEFKIPSSKQMNGLINAELGRLMRLGDSTILLIKNYLSLPDVLKDAVECDIIGNTAVAVAIAKCCNSKDMKSIDMNVSEFLVVCRTLTGDFEGGKVTMRHVIKAEEVIKINNGLTDEQQKETVEIDPSDSDETSETEDKKSSPKALEATRLRGLTREQLNDELEQTKQDLIDLLVYYDPANDAVDPVIKIILLQADLIASLKSSKTTAQKELEKELTIPVSVVEEEVA